MKNTIVATPKSIYEIDRKIKLAIDSLNRAISNARPCLCSDAINILILECEKDVRELYQKRAHAVREMALMAVEGIALNHVRIGENADVMRLVLQFAVDA